MNIEKNRILGLDILRVIAFLSIIIFHCTWIFWAHITTPPIIRSSSLIWRIAEPFARTFDFSGFIILFLSTFLLFFNNSIFSWQKKHFIFLFLGWFIFNVISQYRDHLVFNMSWDIYIFILFSFFFSKTLYKNKKFLLQKTLVSALLLTFPFWMLDQGNYSVIQEVLIGCCPHDYAEWPLFPWLFLITFAGGCGLLFQEIYEIGKTKIHLFEWPLWIFTFLFYKKYFGEYYNTPLGNDWSCYTFRQNGFTFWSHLLMTIFFIRISFLDSVNNFLAKLLLVSNVYKLQINQKFYLAYFFHYILIFFADFVKKRFNLYEVPLFYDLGLIFVILGSELCPRLAVFLIKRLYIIPFQSTLKTAEKKPILPPKNY